MTGPVAPYRTRQETGSLKKMMAAHHINEYGPFPAVSLITIEIDVGVMQRTDRDKICFRKQKNNLET